MPFKTQSPMRKASFIYLKFKPFILFKLWVITLLMCVLWAFFPEFDFDLEPLVIMISSILVPLVYWGERLAKSFLYKSEEIIRMFYDLTASREYEDAWKLLHDDSRHKREYSFDKFKSGYTGTISITDILVLPLTNSPLEHNHEYRVIYKDTIEMPSIRELHERHWQVSDVDTFGEVIKNLSNKISECGYSAASFDQLTLLDLLAPDRSDRVLFHLEEIDSENKKQLFHKRKRVSFLATKLVTVTRNKSGEWKIKDISDDLYQSSGDV